MIRDGLYGGSQTVIDNGDGTQTIKYGNVGYNATTVALAALIGGAAGALLGTNATAAALAAQNEALNNSLSERLNGRYTPPLEGGSLGGGGGQIRFGSAAGAEGGVASGVTGTQKSGQATNNSSGSTPMINGVRVTDRATGNTYQGTLDLQPTLDRIASGVKYPSRNDGTTFKNNEGLLPQQPSGYYTNMWCPRRA